MRLRSRAKKRMILLTVVVVGLGGTVGTAFTLLWQYRQKQNAAFRPLGMKAYADGENIKASDLLLTYLSRHPEDLEALDAYTKVRAKLAESEPALQQDLVNLYRRLISLKPDSMEYKRALLKLYVPLGKYTEAVKLADEMMGIKGSGGAAGTMAGTQPASTDMETLNTKAAAQIMLRNYSAAEQTVNEALRNDPLSLDAVIQLMAIKSNNKEADKLPALVMAQAKGKESDPRVPLLMAMAQMASQHQKEGMEAVREALKVTPPTPEYVRKLVPTLDQMELYAEATAALDKARVQFADKDFQEGYYLRLIYAEEYEKVAADLAKPEAHAETSTALTVFRLIALCELQKKEEAKPLLEVLRDRGERFDYVATNWHDVLDQVYFVTPQKARQVVDACTEALSRQPWNPFFQIYLGDAYATIGDGNEASVRWTNAQRSAQSWSRPLVQLSRAAFLQGSSDQALPLAIAADKRLPGKRETQVALVMAWNGVLSRPGVVIPPGVGSPAELLAKIEEIQKKYPDEETTLPLQVSILVRMNQKSAAEARVKEVVQGKRQPAEQTLLAMSMMCDRLQMPDLTELCLQQCEKIYGMTPSLAITRAKLLVMAGKPEEAKKGMEIAKKGAKGDAEGWGIAWCRLLEAINDKEAAAAWKQLEAASPENTNVLWAVLQANSTRVDRAFIGEILERLKKMVGDGGLTWRLEKAQWLLEDPKNKDNQDAVLKLLIETVNASPQSGRAHVLLAAAYQNSGNVSQAEGELTKAVDLDPMNLTTKLSLARLQLSQNKVVPAQQTLTLVATSGYATDAEKLEAGVRLAQTGETELSTKVLEQASATDTTGQAQWYLASLRWRRGEMDKAEALYTEMLKKPTAEIVETASNFFLARGNVAGADKALEELATLKLAPGEQNRIIGVSYQQRGDAEKAISYLSKSAEEAPDVEETWRRLITSQIGAKKPADAIATAAKAKNVLANDETCAAMQNPSSNMSKLLEDPDTRGYFMTCLMLPEKNKGSGEVATALANVQLNQAPLYAAVVRRLANVYPQSMALQVLTVRKLMQAGQAEDALEFASRAGKMDPLSPLPPLYESVCLAMLGRWQDAMVAAERWHKAMPSDPMNSDMVYAVGLIGLNRSDEAIGYLEKYQNRQNMDPSELRTLISLMTVAKLQQGQAESVDEAAAGMWPYVKDPAWRESWRLLAMEKVPDVTHAKEWLVRLRGATPDKSYGELANLGMAWYAMGARFNDLFSKKKGLDLLNEVAETPGVDAGLISRVSFTLGTLAEHEGDEDTAEQNYRRALKMNESEFLAANNLAMVLGRKGEKLDEAAALAQRAAEGKPDVAAYWDTLGFVQAKLLKIDESQAAYGKAIAKEPTNPIWQIDLADMLLSAGKRDLAAEQFRRAEGNKPTRETVPTDTWQRWLKLQETFRKGAP